MSAWRNDSDNNISAIETVRQKRAVFFVWNIVFFSQIVYHESTVFSNIDYMGGSKVRRKRFFSIVVIFALVFGIIETA